MPVFRENCHCRASWRWVPLHVRPLGLTAAWEHLADLWARPCACLPRVPKRVLPKAQGPGIDASSASSQPAPLSRSPGLSQSPCFPPILCPVGRRLVHHASITQSWALTRGHPLNCGYLLATHCRRAWGPPEAPVAYLYCLLLDCPPRSLQVPPYLSVQGPSFTHKP